MDRIPNNSHPLDLHHGSLSFGHILDAAGIDPGEIVLLRHTFTKTGLTGPEDLTLAKIMAYVREQSVGIHKFPRNPPRIWLNFIAVGGNRCRFINAFENLGESPDERTETLRFYDLVPSDYLSSFQDRLIIEWSNDPVNWAKRGELGAAFKIVEIADSQAEPFPSFEELILSFDQLQTVIEDSRYQGWREVLKSVQGIYLIADAKTGQLYVGKADGSQRILGRWSDYAKTGHGGNVGLRELNEINMSHRNHFLFSILRVFSPGASTAEIDAAENHYKRALLSRQFGLNRN